jgi:hypothetical protein
MNGSWYTWANTHTTPKTFVAAWQHIVKVFRAAETTNVIWLWTVNIVDKAGPIIPDPVSWWPGKSYVTWVGIDGYYYTKSQDFSQIFGPTIVDIRKLTNDPILIAETGASLAADQPDKVTDLFTGIQTYGLLGFMWFNADDTSQHLDWRLSSQALTAYRRDAKTFMKPSTAPSSSRQPSGTSPP